MLKLTLYLLTIVLFFGCSSKKVATNNDYKTLTFTKKSSENLANWNEENFDEALYAFRNNCQTKKAQKLYPNNCNIDFENVDAQDFFETKFTFLKINSEDKTLLTGYYEPQLHGSLIKSNNYPFPLYETPKDLITVNLAAQYKELKYKRLRGKLRGNKIIPYEDRKAINEGKSNATAICYVNSKLDRFFLEVQGSGRVLLDTNTTIFVGYDNQNGHPYKSIGKYLINQNEINASDISLQSIEEWYQNHPSKQNELLEYNPSVVFFKQRNYSATGSLGIELTPMRSIAVDRKHIALGSMLFLNTKKYSQIVMAQDTGGAIKGKVRADLFMGYGDDAKNRAGNQNSPLELYIMIEKRN
jgi:membrane-bound lytic murein transglycosylase A